MNTRNQNILQLLTTQHQKLSQVECLLYTLIQSILIEAANITNGVPSL